MRERLIELLRDTFNYTKGVCIDFDEAVEINADHLLANGVIVLPCKMGDTVYVVSRYYTSTWEIYACEVFDFTIYKNNVFVRLQGDEGVFFGENLSQFNKTVFLTREEAEKALKEAKG